MKKHKLSLLSLLPVLLMLTSIFTACNLNDITTEETSAHETEDPTTTTSETESESFATTESETNASSESIGTDESETEGATEVKHPNLNGENADFIQYANEMANGVNVYYGSGARKNVIVENTEMSFDFNLSSTGNATVSALKNTKGQSYIENTMDVFVKMKSGYTYLATESTVTPTLNMFRLGTYYYEVRFWGQEFMKEVVVENELQFDHTKITHLKNYTDETVTVDGALSVTLSSTSDPQIYFDGVSFATKDYNYFAVTIKIDSKAGYNAAFARCYIPVGRKSAPNEEQVADFSIPADGEYHTIYIPIYKFADYTGRAKMLRLDIDGKVGDKFIIKEIKAVKAAGGNAPSLSLNRLFHTYSDKIQQVIQLTALDDTTDIEKIGMYTKVAADTVEKLIVKDAAGLHDTLEGVDWDSAEYVGFDIKNVGIFGYILLPDETSGKLTVIREKDNYVIEQSRVPEGNALAVPTKDNNILNTKDFYMGQRIYTDETHTFDAFLKEAYCERNPLAEDLIRVRTSDSTDGKYLGYNALRGAYEFTMAHSNFSKAYYNEQNKQYNVSFTVKGDDHDRKIYIMSSLDAGELECAVVLDENDMLLPVDVEVCKNFNDAAEDLYTIVDAPWSETFFPMVVEANEESTLNLLHLYQNWGRAPLKQLSSIQFPMPYYHLSTGATESNCILPWYLTEGARSSLQCLPDFRAMSAPMWSSQPQHIQAGHHEFLQYTDADGNYSASETVNQTIISSGPTYAEVMMDYITDDGKMKITYTHMEMPQTDENRTYYTMTYEVLEDISFTDFKENFSFYSVKADSNTDYERVGFLDENNVFATRPLNSKSSPRYYTLGDECPYFSLYYSPNYKGKNGYANCAFLIANSRFIIGGEEADPRFVISDSNESISLTLDLDEVTFKKGDKFTIHAILLPWGSEKSNYELEDINVRQVRENSLLNPLTLTAEANCERLDTAFLPTARTTDGLNAEFTISGGFNTTECLKSITYLDDFGYIGKYYATIRLKGFAELTIPTVWELVDGEWTRYNLSSHYYPDTSGFTNDYDGYAVDYEDGTFTYSFIVDMTDAKSRTFKFTVDKSQYEAEVEPPYDPEASDIYGDGGLVDGLNYVVNAERLYEQVRSVSTVFGDIKLSAGGKYVTLHSSSTAKEGCFFPFTFNNTLTPVKTGQYVVIKYRLPESNPGRLPLEIFSSTYVYTPLQEQYIGCSSAMIQDGEWHVLVVDLAKMRPTEFAPHTNGAYYAKFLRIDPFYGNTPMQIDFAYIAMDDDFEDILEANKDMEEITYYMDRAYTIKTDGGTLPEIKENEPDPEKPVFVEENGVVANEIDVVQQPLAPFTLYIDGTYNTGRYLVFKYKFDKQALAGQFLILAATTNGNAADHIFQPKDADGNAVNLYADMNFYSQIKPTQDGQWHIAMFDLSDGGKNNLYIPNSEGNYFAKYVYLQLAVTQGTDAAFTVDYVAFADNLEDIRAYVTQKSDLPLCVHTLAQNGTCALCGSSAE